MATIVTVTVITLLWCTLLGVSYGQIQACQRPLDISFVVYCDPGISDRDWNSTTSLISGVSAGLSLSTYGSHVSTIYFSKSAFIIGNLDDELILGHRLSESGRNMSGGMWKATNQVFTNTAGDRPEVPDKLIVIAMVVSDNTTASVAEAAAAKSLGIHVVTVGIGTDQAMIEELKSVATNPEEAEQLIISSADQYAMLIQPIIDVICAPTAEASNGDIRLVDGNYTSGRVEMYWNMEWVTISNQSWSTHNTRIACTQLGYPNGVAVYSGNSSVYVRRIGLTSVQCTGSETNLLQCQHDEFFVNGNQLSHRQDVFLRCLCDNCSDYVEDKDALRLVNGTSMSGRLEAFVFGTGYQSLCATAWTNENNRVACRQLKFADGAGTYTHSKQIYFPPILQKYINCTGTESALSECPFGALPPLGCYDPLCIRCMCASCTEILVGLPAQQLSSTGSNVTFEWKFDRDMSTRDLNIWFMSGKNPQLLLKRTDGVINMANTDFKDRIRLLNGTHASVTFELAEIIRTDMGWYALNIDLQTVKICNQQAALYVDDFAVSPPSDVHLEKNESLELIYDLRPLRHLGDIAVEAYITTPPSGHLRLEYYYGSWLLDNMGYTNDPQDHLMPSVYVKTVQGSDSGMYLLNITVTCVSLAWLNPQYSFNTSVTIEGYEDSCAVSDSSSSILPYCILLNGWRYFYVAWAVIISSLPRRYWR